MEDRHRLKGYTDKLVFSFVDVKAYRKVQNNLIKETHCFTKENVETAELNEAQRLEIVEGLAKLRDVWKAEGWNLTLATCAEEIDLEDYGIEHNRCIDGELMERVSAKIRSWFTICIPASCPNRIYSERFLLFLLNGKI